MYTREDERGAIVDTLNASTIARVIDGVARANG